MHKTPEAEVGQYRVITINKLAYLYAFGLFFCHGFDESAVSFITAEPRIILYRLIEPVLTTENMNTCHSNQRDSYIGYCTSKHPGPKSCINA